MTYYWIENIDDFKNIAKEWDEVLISSGDYNPFLLSDFIITWWKHFSGNLKLKIFVILKDKKVAGGMPLCIQPGKKIYSFARILSYIGGSAANYTEPLYGCDNVEVLPLIKEALEGRRDWDVFHLSDIRDNGRIMKECRSYPVSKGFYSRVIQDHSNWAIDTTKGLEGYFSGISGKLKRDLNAKRKHLIKRYGEICLKEITDKKDVENSFDVYARFSRSSFKAKGKKSNFESTKYTTFFKELLGLMNQKKRLDAHVLCAGEKITAVSFAYKFGRGFNRILSGFNPDLQYYRPGYLLTEELVRRTYGRGVTYHNLYGHERLFKNQLCNEQSPLYRFFLIRSSLRGNGYRLFSSIERLLRANKAVLSIAQKLKRN